MGWGWGGGGWGGWDKVNGWMGWRMEEGERRVLGREVWDGSRSGNGNAGGTGVGDAGKRRGGGGGGMGGKLEMDRKSILLDRARKAMVRTKYSMENLSTYFSCGAAASICACVEAICAVRVETLDLRDVYVTCIRPVFLTDGGFWGVGVRSFCLRGRGVRVECAWAAVPGLEVWREGGAGLEGRACVLRWRGGERVVGAF